MTFPNEPRPMVYELQVGATDWANITPYVYALRQPTTVSRGVPSEYSQSAPSESTLWLNNANGLFSPRNPLSSLYGLIGKNTPVRWGVGDGTIGMVTSGVANSGGGSWTSDKAALDITGDLDVRVDLELRVPGIDDDWTADSWTTGSFDLASKYDGSDTTRSWSFVLTAGKLRLYWFTAGTLASVKQAESTVTLPVPAQNRRALRFTIDVDNGAAGNTVTFYTAPTNSGPWTQLGAPVTQAGVTSIFSGAGALRFGGSSSSGGAYTYARAPYAVFYSGEMRNAINGGIVANPIFTTQPLDAVPFSSSSFSDGLSNTWFFIGQADAARIWYRNVDYRFHGECSSFPNRWDTSGNDAWVPITAAGLLRRLGQAQEPADTGLQTWILSQSPQPVSYFPLTGAEGTKYSVNRGRVGNNSLRFYPEGTVVYTYGKPWDVPWLDTGMEYNASALAAGNDMRADVVCADNNFVLDFVYQSPVINSDTGGTLNTNIGLTKILLWSYDYDRWQLQLNDAANGGTLQITWWAGDSVGTFTFPATAALPALLDNEIHTVRFTVRSIAGPGQAYAVYIDGQLVQSNSLATTRALNGTSLYQMTYARYVGQTVANFGHMTLWTSAIGDLSDVPSAADFYDAVTGYTGELAGDRLLRVADLGGIPLVLEGNAADTMPMGAQYAEPRLTQLRDAENADMGILGERRGAFGLRYRTRVSMFDQAPALTLDYSLGQIVPPFEPTDDDQLTKNDWSVQRRDGNTARVQLTTGRMSIQEPPAGVGQYADQTTVNVETDGVLPGVAAWMVNLGTVDKARYPAITVDLGILAAAGLDAAARAVDFGDLLVLKNMQELGVYDDVRLLVLGTVNETVSDGGYKHTITWSCAPYDAYEGAVYGTSASVGADRYDTENSTLVAALTAGATTFQVASPRTLWTTDAAAFPLDVIMEGERMTVGAITGTTSPQTFSSVTRAVNGVSRAHSAGADIRLFTPAKYTP